MFRSQYERQINLNSDMTNNMDENPSCALNHKANDGEPAGVRTRDLLIKSQLLYRLSYRLPNMGYAHSAFGGVR
jgi:hypothetical protein